MPSALQSRLEEDLKSALKTGEKRRVATIRLVLSSLKNERILQQRELTDEEVESALRRAVKQRKDSIEQFGRGGREDLVAAETEELRILEGYLPRTMDDAELEAAIRAIAAEKGFRSPRDVGPLMKELMSRHRAGVDGRRASEIARRVLA